MEINQLIFFKCFYIIFKVQEKTLPVIATVLQFTDDEANIIKKNCNFNKSPFNSMKKVKFYLTIIFIKLDFWIQFFKLEKHNHIKFFVFLNYSNETKLTKLITTVINIFIFKYNFFTLLTSIITMTFY